MRPACLFFLSFLVLFSLSAGAAERITYFVPDAQGSPVAAMDEQGNVLWRESYAPYGARKTNSPDNNAKPAYTGKPEDAGTGLVYMGARMYDPETARFTGIDPQGFNEGNVQSFGRYVYANNSPYLYVDPNGEAGVLGAALLVAAGVLAVDYANAPESSGDIHQLTVLEVFGQVTDVTSLGSKGLLKAAIKESAGDSEKNKKFYRYVGEREAEAIRRTGEIPNVDAAGNEKSVYFTSRLYKTAGKAKTHNQLPSKPAYRVDIDPANVPNRTPFTRVNPGDHPQWGAGGGVEATTRDAIPVGSSAITRLKGG